MANLESVDFAALSKAIDSANSAITTLNSSLYVVWVIMGLAILVARYMFMALILKHRKESQEKIFIGECRDTINACNHSLGEVAALMPLVYAKL